MTQVRWFFAILQAKFGKKWNSSFIRFFLYVLISWFAVCYATFVKKVMHKKNFVNWQKDLDYSRLGAFMCNKLIQDIVEAMY